MPNGTVDLVKSSKTQIDGEMHTVGDTKYIFKTGTIRKYGDKSIARGVLAVDTSVTIGGSPHTLVADTKVFFEADGNFIQGKTASTHVSSHNYVIKGNVFSFSSAPSNHYDWVVKSGRLNTVSSNTKVVGGGVTNTFSFRWTIYFHDNGVVRSGSLATASSNTKIVGWRCHQHLYFFEYEYLFPREWCGVGGEIFCGVSRYEGGGYSER